MKSFLIYIEFNLYTIILFYIIYPTLLTYLYSIYKKFIISNLIKYKIKCIFFIYHQNL